MSLPAEFPGWCGNCDAPIDVGQLIRSRGAHELTSRYVHVECPESVPDAPPAVCPRCHLTICDCE